MQGATSESASCVYGCYQSFNPRPLCRERRLEWPSSFYWICFNPRPLCRERPSAIRIVVCCMPSFNPRPLCRERLPSVPQQSVRTVVSIHAPYAGSDLVDKADFCYVSVSIHAPYAGSDAEVSARCGNRYVSIHAPYAGSDMRVCPHTVEYISFNPRPLCRERH